VSRASAVLTRSPSQLLAFFGVLSLGIGDAVASIVGRRIGYTRWSGASGKTLEGSAGFTISVVASAVAMWLVGAVDSFGLAPFVVTTVLAMLMEAFSAQNDNLVLPIYGWAVGSLLGV
jgi:dolichol kinase